MKPTSPSSSRHIHVNPQGDREVADPHALAEPAVVLLRRRKEPPEDVVPRLEQPGLRLTDKRSPN